MITTTEATNRVVALDGIRGIAILLVIGFHFFYHNASPYNPTNLYPYGEALAWNPIFKYGYLGVELFFIVSGFVIALTLDTCKSPFDFALRRFARIWPALIVCSSVTYIVLRYSGSPYSALKNVDWSFFLPSWTLSQPQLWRSFSPRADLIDGVYWSLVVEIRFYVIAAVLYWGFSRSSLGKSIVFYTLGAALIKAALNRLTPGMDAPFDWFFISGYIPWFAAGVVFFELANCRRRHNPRHLPARRSRFLPSGHDEARFAAMSLALFGHGTRAQARIAAVGLDKRRSHRAQASL
jgi:peptidoglycan/LPS O-acetylase OafA/YrhL